MFNTFLSPGINKVDRFPEIKGFISKSIVTDYVRTIPRGQVVISKHPQKQATQCIVFVSVE